MFGLVVTKKVDCKFEGQSRTRTVVVFRRQKTNETGILETRCACVWSPMCRSVQKSGSKENGRVIKRRLATHHDEKHEEGDGGDKARDSGRGFDWHVLTNYDANTGKAAELELSTCVDLTSRCFQISLSFAPFRFKIGGRCTSIRRCEQKFIQAGQLVFQI